jgi:hypothetical protein
MIDNAEYNSMNSRRTTGDEQQQDGRRNRAMSNGKFDFRFLIPSRDAGGLLNYILYNKSIKYILFDIFKQLLVKVEKLFKIFVLNIVVKFKWLIVTYPNVF